MKKNNLKRTLLYSGAILSVLAVQTGVAQADEYEEVVYYDDAQAGYDEDYSTDAAFDGEFDVAALNAHGVNVNRVGTEAYYFIDGINRAAAYEGFDGVGHASNSIEWIDETFGVREDVNMGVVSESSFLLIQEAYDTMPVSIQEQVDSITVYNNPDSPIIGLTYIGYADVEINQAYLDGASNGYDEEVHTLYHEVGHIIDTTSLPKVNGQAQFISQTEPAFEAIWQSYYPNFTKVEAFAESFKDYLALYTGYMTDVDGDYGPLYQYFSELMSKYGYDMPASQSRYQVSSGQVTQVDVMDEPVSQGVLTQTVYETVASNYVMTETVTTTYN